MTWRLRDLVAKLPDVMEDRFICPTGKQPFATKAAGRSMLRKINPSQRSTMRVFRCGYCERYHIGHRRGQIF